MAQALIGLGFILFGLLVGGVGLATAGVGVGIPMIPLGICLLFRGARQFAHDQEEEAKSAGQPSRNLEPFEKTRSGRIGLGILLVLIGMATSAILIGIPIGLLGVTLIAHAFGAFKVLRQGS